jgi:hypothetical protein
MPKASVWFIRMALIYLVLGFTFGGLLLAHKGLGWTPAAWMLLPSHVEFLFLGWTFQLAAGMAYWILPRFGRGQPRGDPRLPWPAFFLINAGILLVVFQTWVGWGWLLPLGRLAEALGAATFLLTVWQRVKPFAR